LSAATGTKEKKKRTNKSFDILYIFHYISADAYMRAHIAILGIPPSRPLNRKIEATAHFTFYAGFIFYAELRIFAIYINILYIIYFTHNIFF